MKRRLSKFIIKPILKVGLTATLLITLILCTLDLLSNLEQYMSLEVSVKTIALRTLYYSPEAILMAIGPAFLFSITYFLSQLQASNEITCLLNSGIAYSRILTPIVFLSIFLSVGYFFFSEYVGIDALMKKNEINQQLSLSSTVYDNRNVTIIDPDGGYTLFAKRYSDSRKKLTDTVLIAYDMEKQLKTKITSDSATYDNKIENWVFEDNTIYDVINGQLKITYENSKVIEDLSISPNMFKNLSADIKTLDRETAREYLEQSKKLDPTKYAQVATEYYQRILSCLTPLVLMIIACCFNYKFKKNVLFFSIVFCLCIAVVYYVVQMLTLIMANQGMIAPALGMIIPFVVIILISLGLLSTFKS